MKTSTVVWIVAVLAVLIGGWYWYSQSQTTGMAASPSGALGVNGSDNQGNMGGADTGTPQQPQGDGTGVGENLILGTSSSASLGQFLTAFNGMTLYTTTKTSCTGDCAVNWPPYTVASASDIHVPASITGDVGTVARADGSLQVTYKGMPLYFYKSDTKVGDTTGHNVGGVWFVAKP